MRAFATFARPVEQQGQSLAEYALILALIAILAVGALLFLGVKITDILSQVGQSF